MPHFVYDVEQSWLAPGFSAGFGYIESSIGIRQIYLGGTNIVNKYEVVPRGVIDADGTRHQLQCKSSYQVSGSNDPRCTSYETSDGSFIQVNANGWFDNTNHYDTTSFVAVYSDGTKVSYLTPFGNGNERKHYPSEIRDRNGNRISINYTTDQTGRIDYIRDTLKRYVRFYYDGTPEKKLVAVTAPGYGINPDRQTIRFYYQSLSLNYEGKFASGSQVTGPPAPINVLSHVYFPATKSGFKYEYHPAFGMITKIQRFQNMQVSDETSLTSTGTVTNENTWTWAATTEYNFESGSPALEDVPKYTQRIDDWQGRTAAAPTVTQYNVPEPAYGDLTQKSEVIVHDPNNGADIINRTISHKTSDWKDGLVSEVYVESTNGQLTSQLSKTKYFWKENTPSFGRRKNPVLEKIEVTNEANQTKATLFDYDQYGNQILIDERDFAAPGSVGVSLRRIETTYETRQNWIAANLLRLPISVVVKADTQTVSKTLYEYDHEGTDADLVRRDDIDVETHDIYYNPARPATCRKICPTGDPEIPVPCGSELREANGCVITQTYGYKAGSAYRGNLTKVVRLLDTSATNESGDPGANTTSLNYDIAGNLVETSLSCCNVKTISYDLNNGYAYPVKETRGDAPQQLVSFVEYDRNTGLVTATQDENNQRTVVAYDAVSLRQTRIDRPNGGWTAFEYQDAQAPNYVKTTTALGENKTAVSYSYPDGRGANTRSAMQTPDGWLISAVTYDSLGRSKKIYNPFYSSTATASIPAGVKWTEVSATDAFGRTTQLKQQDDSIVEASYNESAVLYNDPDNQARTGTVSRTKDQSGREQRQVVDALGRIVRIDEPTTDGLGGLTSPNQPTYYWYDGNDNLTRVSQSKGAATQERAFRYDALSRLTHEKQVEATPRLSDAGVWHETGGKWTKVLKYDNRNLLRESIDARGVKTSFPQYDGLNRVEQVTFSDGTPGITYTYDQARNDASGNPYMNKGHLTRVATAAGDVTLRPDTPATATEFDYDKMGQAVKHRQIIGAQTYNLEYGYNLAGQLTSETYPSGKVVAINYDAAGRLSAIADSNRIYASGFQYQGKAGLMSAYNLANGTTEIFTLNDRLQMESQSLKKGAEVIQRYDYSFGQINLDTGAIVANSNNGQLAKIASYIGTQKQWEQRFAYDSVSRLSEAREYKQGDSAQLSYKQRFDYDRFGNLYRKAQNNPVAGQQTPIGFTPIEEADISKTTNQFTANTQYDDAGNVIQDTKFRNLKYFYDANGRMYKTSNIDNTNQADSVYDASGQRVATKVNGVWTYQIYDVNLKLVAEYGQRSGDGGVKYTFKDWQGSTRAITKQSGVLQARLDYQAFGQEIGAGIGQRSTTQGYNADNNINQKYGLIERDGASGLDHAWFRKLEQNAGRWTSPDPYGASASIVNPQSFNRYAYVENQPTNFIDPNGLNEEAPIRIHTRAPFWNWADPFFYGWGAEFGGNFEWLYDEYPVSDLLDAAQGVIENAEKNKDSDCAKLLGPNALEKFKELRKNDKIKYKSGVLNATTGAQTVGDNITLNPDSFTFDPDYKMPIIEGYKRNNENSKRVTEGFNKAYKNSGASSRHEYAVATIIHEFLHAIGKFAPDVSEDALGQVDASQSLKNQKEVIKKCFSDDK